MAIRFERGAGAPAYRERTLTGRMTPCTAYGMVQIIRRYLSSHGRYTTTTYIASRIIAAAAMTGTIEMTTVRASACQKAASLKITA